MDGVFVVYSTPNKGSLFAFTVALDAYCPSSPSSEGPRNPLALSSAFNRLPSPSRRPSIIASVPPHLVVLSSITFVNGASALVVSALPTVQSQLRHILQRLGMRRREGGGGRGRRGREEGGGREKEGEEGGGRREDSIVVINIY